MWADALDALNQAVVDTDLGFGQTCTLTPTIGTPYTVRAVVDESADPFADLPGRNLLEIRYTATVRAADLPADPAQGDTLTTAGGTEYRVQEPPHQLHGLWHLTLRKL